MQVMFSSKTAELTDKVKLFLLTKLERLQKFQALGIQNFQVIVDRVKRGGRTTSEAQIEVIAQLKSGRYAFKEVGENFYQAFYRLYEKMEKKLRREKRERRDH